MVINVLSDNANRATADVKSTVNKREGKIAEQGSVLFMYDRKGKVEVDAVLEEEALMEAAIEAGCDDMELVEVSHSLFRKEAGPLPFVVSVCDIHIPIWV